MLVRWNHSMNCSNIWQGSNYIIDICQLYLTRVHFGRYNGIFKYISDNLKRDSRVYVSVFEMSLQSIPDLLF